HFQVLDLAESSKDIVLNSISEESIVLFRTHIFEWQHSDALFGNRCGLSRGRCNRLAMPLHYPEVQSDKSDDKKRCDRNNGQSFFLLPRDCNRLRPASPRRIELQPLSDLRR